MGRKNQKIAIKYQNIFQYYNNQMNDFLMASRIVSELLSSEVAWTGWTLMDWFGEQCSQNILSNCRTCRQALQ